MTDAIIKDKRYSLKCLGKMLNQSIRHCFLDKSKKKVISVTKVVESCREGRWMKFYNGLPGPLDRNRNVHQYSEDLHSFPDL